MHMNRILAYVLIAVFSIFFGSQITEGCLLVPYWKSLSTAEFYAYYSQFGVGIGRFYTVLTIIAACIPICISIFSFYNEYISIIYSLLSSFFIFLCVAVYYLYFKDINQHFFDANLSPSQLKSEINTWANWHWFRLFLEFIALIFLIIAFNDLSVKKAP